MDFLLLLIVFNIFSRLRLLKHYLINFKINEIMVYYRNSVSTITLVMKGLYLFIDQLKLVT